MSTQSPPGAWVGVGRGVAVGGRGVAVGGRGVEVGGRGVEVGGRGVAVGGVVAVGAVVAVAVGAVVAVAVGAVVAVAVGAVVAVAVGAVVAVAVGVGVDGWHSGRSGSKKQGSRGSTSAPVLLSVSSLTSSAQTICRAAISIRVIATASNAAGTIFELMSMERPPRSCGYQPRLSLFIRSNTQWNSKT